MKILLIQSYLGRKQQPVLPLGLIYLASHLGKHEVKILDPNTEDDPYNSIKNRLAEFRPDLVGISLRNVDTTSYQDMFYYYKTLDYTTKLIKSIMPGSYLVIGGPAFSLYAEEIMRRNPRIDFGVYLDGEDTFPELIDNLPDPTKVEGVYYRKNAEVFFSGFRKPYDFTRPSELRKDLIDLNKYNHAEVTSGIGIQSKRGCCLTCAYCTYPFITGSRLRLRSPDRVVDEIEELNRKYGITNFMFNDSVFNLPRSHAVDISREIKRRNINVNWSAYFSLKNIDREFIELAVEAGCKHFFFSPDGYSKKSLLLLKKEIGLKDIRNAYELVKNLKTEDIRFDFSFFINSPGETYLSFLKILWLMLKTNFILPRKKFMHISLNVPRLEPHTALYRLAVKQRTISQTTNLLPEDENRLSSLFYKNPDLRLTESIYRLLLKIHKKLKKKS